MFNLSPAILKFFDLTIPPKDITAISVVPPPISITILPTGSFVGKRIPIAPAIGSSTIWTSLAPAFFVASRTARISTFVTPLGTPTTTLGPNIFGENSSARCLSPPRRLCTARGCMRRSGSGMSIPISNISCCCWICSTSFRSVWTRFR